MVKSYSVLMSVYYKEQPEYLRQAINSMMNQTIRTDDFVLICDGPLTPELDQVINIFKKNYPRLFHVVRLEKNVGLGKALNLGVRECKNELIARMDSDDISVIDRCESQIKLFVENPSLDICSGSIAEFEKDIQNITGIRKLPSQNEALKKYAKKRNPINHMAVMFQKKAVLSAGNYQDLAGAEDYYLWIRMMMMGSVFANSDKILVYARTDNGMILRRGGLRYIKNIFKLQLILKKMKFITTYEYINNCLIRCGIALLPPRIRQCFYANRLRSKE